MTRRELFATLAGGAAAVPAFAEAAGEPRYRDPKPGRTSLYDSLDSPLGGRYEAQVIQVDIESPSPIRIDVTEAIDFPPPPLRASYFCGPGRVHPEITVVRDALWRGGVRLHFSACGQPFTLHEVKCELNKFCLNGNGEGEPL